jgi:hypothetical protein
MRSKILALAVIAAAALPLSAQAQQRVIIDNGGVTTGFAGGPPGGGLITEVQRPRFRQYIVEEQLPSFTVDEPIAVGTVLPPEAGVTYYDVPERFGATTYRYTIVNDHSILVDPRSRRVVQVIE